jgi:hypothetical protein
MKVFSRHFDWQEEPITGCEDFTTGRVLRSTDMETH